MELPKNKKQFNEGRARGFVTIIALWIVAIGVVVTLEIQSVGFETAASGRIAIARTHAKWAARAGLEAMIASIAETTLRPDTSNVYAEIDAASAGGLASGAFERSSYLVWSSFSRGEVLGPADPHAKMNINLMTEEDLLNLPYMTQDTAQAILDWIDSDDEPNQFGAERNYYERSEFPYMPRNAPICSMLELELIAGVEPVFVRNEDWNLNGILDPNENDGEQSWPNDNADGVLDAGWSAIVTASSLGGGTIGNDGKSKLLLSEATASDLSRRTGMGRSQSNIVIEHVARGNAQMIDFLQNNLLQIATRNNGGEPPRTSPAPLQNEQLAALLDNCMVEFESNSRVPGKININICSAVVMDLLSDVGSDVKESFLAERESGSKGFYSMADVLSIPGVTREKLAELYDRVDIRSEAFVVTSKGHDKRTGLEFEIIGTIDRTVMPIVIREYVQR